jgi:hypothetical protein
LDRTRLDGPHFGGVREAPARAVQEKGPDVDVARGARRLLRARTVSVVLGDEVEEIVKLP